MESKKDMDFYEKNISEISARGMSAPTLPIHIYIEYCAKENFGVKIQFMI
jgi:hypothetical protein